MKLRIINELKDGRLEVQDMDGVRWIISKEAYKKFKRIGFFYIPETKRAAFRAAYEQHSIAHLIEAVTGEPLQNIFPDLANSLG